MRKIRILIFCTLSIKYIVNYSIRFPASKRLSLWGLAYFTFPQESSEITDHFIYERFADMGQAPDSLAFPTNHFHAYLLSLSKEL